jgi:hypothetical protein
LPAYRTAAGRQCRYRVARSVNRGSRRVEPSGEPFD